MQDKLVWTGFALGIVGLYWLRYRKGSSNMMELPPPAKVTRIEDRPGYRIGKWFAVVIVVMLLIIIALTIALAGFAFLSWLYERLFG